MSDNKTKPTEIDARDFINSVQNKTRREDALRLLDIFAEITGEPPVMWGPSIIGFGSYHYRYASGREGDFLRCGFSPRAANMVLYLISGANARPDLLKELGPHKTGASCLYIGPLQKIELDVLKLLIKADWDEMQRRFPT